MKKISTFFLLAILVQLSYSQQIVMPKIEVDAIYLGRGKEILAQTKSYPPHTIYTYSDYKYEIKVRMKFPQGYIPDFSQYGIVYILPDFKVKKSSLNPKNIKQYEAQEFAYVFRLKVKKNGWLRIFVAQKKDFLRDTDVHFYDNTSNKVNIYLSTVLK
jgi:hypothetical protein